MPFASNGTLKLHWESAGEGPAVLLIAGQGMTSDAWWATLPVLAPYAPAHAAACIRVPEIAA